MPKLTGVEQNIKEMYDQYNFGDYCIKRKEVPSFLPLLVELLRKVKKNDNIYDIGCGSGRLTRTYLNLGIEKRQITCVDIAAKNIDRLRSEGFKAYRDNVLRLKLDTNVSDLTICNGVIHHTIDPFCAFSELVRITKPGGYLYLNVYNKFHPYYYFVHKLMYPLRYLYWQKKQKKFIDYIVKIIRVLLLPISYLKFRRILDEKTLKIIFMDQVMTPRAHLFSKAMIKSYAKKFKLEPEKVEYNCRWLMIAAIIPITK